MEPDDETGEPTGRAKGGVAAAQAMTAEQLTERGKKGAAARWSGPIVEATHGSPDHPLKIGDIEIPCYVLADETRVLSQRGLQTGIGMSISGGSVAGEQRLATFLDSLTTKGLEINDVTARIRKPIRFFLPPPGRRQAHGYEATILADICDAILAARKLGLLQPQQLHIADRCEILLRGFARVGIIALVDEATGFQRDRKRDALSKILEAFIAKELQPWIRTFPADYYEQMFRLRGLEYPKDTVKRPQYFGVLTNNIVYERLAPGVLEELKKVTVRDEDGRPKHRYFQRLTSNVGYPKLREHLGAVVAVMKLSNQWGDFMLNLNRLYPRLGVTLELPFDYAPEQDNGKGL
jgi:hypothetical protein